MEINAVKHHMLPVLNMEYVISKAKLIQQNSCLDTLPIQRVIVIYFLNISIKIMQRICTYIHLITELSRFN